MDSIRCEHMVQRRLPSIRREIAISMMRQYGLSQKEVADMLNITNAAVCQYVSKKRGNKTILNEDIIREVDISATRIYNNNNTSFSSEVCRICQVMKSNDRCCPINIIEKSR